MADRRTLRLATLLGPNTVDDLHRIGSRLRDRGFGAAIADVGTGDDTVAARLTEHRIDVLWACGLLTAELVAGGFELDVVAAPVFDGETEPVYRSVIVTRADTTGPIGRLAVNEYGSWSGYRALFHDALARSHDRWHPDRMDELVVTGAHVASVAAVAAGRADAAAIDHSVWDWLVSTDPGAVDGIVVVDRTVDCPAPPISLGPGVRAEERTAMTAALLDLDGPPRLVGASIDDYRFMLT